MQNIVLAIHLILAILMIVIVLTQRSEGGGLGIGAGGNLKATERGVLDAIGKMTWYIAGGFIVTSLTLTVMSSSQDGKSSILDGIDQQIETEQTKEPESTVPELPKE